MQHTTRSPELVGYLQLQVGSLAVNVPIKKGGQLDEGPLAKFETDGNSVVIVVHGDAGSADVERAVGDEGKKALAYLSRKLLN